MSQHLLPHYSLIAQLVEQMTVNHWVAGSSPARGANILKGRFTKPAFFTFGLSYFVLLLVQQQRVSGNYFIAPQSHS
jgi:hypothetical protein